MRSRAQGPSIFIKNQKVDSYMLEIKEEVYNSVNIKVETPDGRMFVTIMEGKDGKPFKILVNIGKSGRALAAWADGLAEFISLSLQNIGLDPTIKNLIGHKSDKYALQRNEDGVTVVHSGPDGIAHALVRYRADKYHRLLRSFGVSPDENDEDYFRPANSA